MTTLTRDGYRPRIVDKRLDVLLRSFGAVEIVGPKWCGKPERRWPTPTAPIDWMTLRR